MEGIWLVSYIILWLAVLTMGVLIFLLYRQLGIMYLGSAEGVSRDGLPVGTPAPDFRLTDQYGNVQQLSAYRGKPVYLVFGSPGCSPCRVLLPQAHEWLNAHPEMSIIWLNAAPPEETLKYVSDMGATLPVVGFTPDDKVMENYRVRVTPFSFMVDEQGIIRAKGLVNTKAGIDLYYKEMRTGKQQPAMAGGAG
jgi:methylamine dehydrogenase accessory protein MauD